MKNDGKAEATLKTTSFALGKLAKHADLNNPEQVKQYVASLEVTSTYKQNIIKAYARYARCKNIIWQKPKYDRDTKQPQIPTSAKLETLIGKAGKILSLKLEISYRTGMRPVEVVNLKAKDIDFEHNNVTPAVYKHGAPRTIPIPEHLKDRLKQHVNENKLNLNDKLFKGNVRSYCGNYQEMRHYLANKLGDQSIKRIRLYDFRHHFATMLYHKTQNIMIVKYLLGHKRLETTQIYTQLLAYNNDEWIAKCTDNKDEAMKLIEAGFEYVQQINGHSLYRKRK